MYCKTKNELDAMQPQEAFDQLIAGNQRFCSGEMVTPTFKQDMARSAAGQFPFAVVLSCIDSRVPAEIIFDQGIGDIFSVRVAGNIVNEDILASIEYACGVVGSKLLVVLGHTRCGAVTAACGEKIDGHIGMLTSKIEPAIKAVEAKGVDSEVKVEAVIAANADMVLDQILKQSTQVKSLLEDGVIGAVSALYDVAAGSVQVRQKLGL